MEQFFNNFHFLRPWWLLLLLLPVYAYFRFDGMLQRVSAWEGVCDKNLLRFLLIKGSSRQRGRVLGLCLLGLTAAVLALAGPTWQKKEIPSMAPENPLMIALNLSSDMSNTDVTPDRLARAKYAIADLLQLIPGTQAGLMVYTSEPFLISPVTEDTDILTNLLPAVNRDVVPENGDRVDRAVDLAVKRFESAGYHKGNIVIFAADAGQEFEAALRAAAAAADKGYIVNTVAVGAAGSERLRLLAERGKGAYVELAKGVAVLAQYLNASRQAQLSESRNFKEAWEDFGYYLIFIPLVCCLYLFRRGIMVVVVAMSWISAAQAGFFLNNNQEGMQAFERADYEKAADKFEDASWKASAYYRMGNYEKALEYFSMGNDTEALYNQGNALAKSGKTEEAIAKYEEVLKSRPDHEDAKFNLEYLKKQQEQNQSSSSQDKQNNDSSSEEDKSGADDNQQQNQEQQQEKAQQNVGSGKEQSQSEQQQQNNKTGDSDGNSTTIDREKSESNSATSGLPEEREQKDGETPATARPGEENENNGQKYDEQLQAREQQFRDIPEDAGGLLRAFIQKEYMKNRYKDK